MDLSLERKESLLRSKHSNKLLREALRTLAMAALHAVDKMLTLGVDQEGTIKEVDMAEGHSLLTLIKIRPLIIKLHFLLYSIIQ